jgi:hypothetical protein
MSNPIPWEGEDYVTSNPEDLYIDNEASCERKTAIQADTLDLFSAEKNESKKGSSRRDYRIRKDGATLTLDDIYKIYNNLDEKDKLTVRAYARCLVGIVQKNAWFKDYNFDNALVALARIGMFSVGVS